MEELFDKIEKDLVENARQELKKVRNDKKKINNDEYKKRLKNLARGKCGSCGKDLKIKKLEIIDENKFIEYMCGHKDILVYIHERIKVWEQIKGKIREKDKKSKIRFMFRTEPGKNSKSIDGVKVSWTADRENNKWTHEIIDIKSGKTLHKDDEPLDQHKHL